MPVTFFVPGYLRAYTAGAGKVTIPRAPSDVGAALAALCDLHPGVRDRVLNERGEVRQHVNVFVGNESIRFTGGLGTPVAEGSEIWIVPAVSGG
ncbi:MAG TPA: MoaD/ThiS family protein [Candidatus Eisenbacteria bacterium]|jgi:molybdopterin converting factor small subunit